MVRSAGSKDARSCPRKRRGAQVLGLPPLKSQGSCRTDTLSLGASWYQVKRHHRSPYGTRVYQLDSQTVNHPKRRLNILENPPVLVNATKLFLSFHSLDFRFTNYFQVAVPYGLQFSSGANWKVNSDQLMKMCVIDQRESCAFLWTQSRRPSEAISRDCEGLSPSSLGNNIKLDVGSKEKKIRIFNFKVFNFVIGKTNHMELIGTHVLRRSFGASVIVNRECQREVRPAVPFRTDFQSSPTYCLRVPG
ncbi:hypothetical protein MJG53_015774 [Ovis ammon polii x Ovis aries]|uniref:Uncharacterized protein n=1 Tax=Ovis ammon polii x Ovis aries TaxID=2918886 RepID=A0ACB9UCJ9_9CETA|nr:hypothetical protein MJG53_015774 [Ovis ammon polii x Ovis aries]